MQVAAGIIGAPPVPKGATAFQYTVSTQGRLTDEEQFGEIIVKTGANGQVTRVRDIARVELAARDYTVNSSSAENQRRRSRFSSSRARTRSRLPMQCARKWLSSNNVSLPASTTRSFTTRRFRPRINSRSSEDALRSDRACRARRLDLSPNLARLNHPSDRGAGFADRHIRGDERLRFLHQQSLAVRHGPGDRDRGRRRHSGGQAIEHHIEDGLSPRDAARKAMTEVGGALVAIALVLCSVFIPTAFIAVLPGHFSASSRSPLRSRPRSPR